MDAADSLGSAPDAAAVYAATMARRSLDQQRVQGAQAVQLIDAALAPAPAPSRGALPLDATFSVRV